MTTARTDPAEAERLCLDGIELVAMYSGGETGAALAELSDEAPEALCLYAQLLEATILTLYAGARQPTDIPTIRESARVTARAWRQR